MIDKKMNSTMNTININTRKNIYINFIDIGCNCKYCVF